LQYSGKEKKTDEEDFVSMPLSRKY